MPNSLHGKLDFLLKVPRTYKTTKERSPGEGGPGFLKSNGHGRLLLWLTNSALRVLVASVSENVQRSGKLRQRQKVRRRQHRRARDL